MCKDVHCSDVYKSKTKSNKHGKLFRGPTACPQVQFSENSCKGSYLVLQGNNTKFPK